MSAYLIHEQQQPLGRRSRTIELPDDVRDLELSFWELQSFGISPGELKPGKVVIVDGYRLRFIEQRDGYLRWYFRRGSRLVTRLDYLRHRGRIASDWVAYRLILTCYIWGVAELDDVEILQRPVWRYLKPMQWARRRVARS